MQTTPACRRKGLKMVEGMSAEQFADFCAPFGGTEQQRKFFNLIGWPEGYVYCGQSRNYAIQSGFQCIQTLKRQEGL